MDSSKVSRDSIPNFIVGSDREVFTGRYLVSAGQHATATALDDLNSGRIPGHIIVRSDFLASPVDFADFFDPVRRDSSGVALPLRTPRDYQRECIKRVVEHFAEHNWAQVVMACGTGKTFTALRLCERYLAPDHGDRDTHGQGGGDQGASGGGVVLYLLPSLALVTQTLSEFCYNYDSANFAYRFFVVCSDSTAGRRRGSDTDAGSDISPAEFSFTVTTSGERLSRQLFHRRSDETGTKPVIDVVFSTYHSLTNCITDAQQKHSIPTFDLVVCDEAHRTAGVQSTKSRKKAKEAGQLADEAISSFHAVHHDHLLRTKKRLYMTAIPRIGTAEVRSVAKDNEIPLYDMADEALFGKKVFTFGFRSAVDAGYLSEYRIVVLKVDDTYIEKNLVDELEQVNANGIETGDLTERITLEDASKLIGIYKALRDQGEHFGIQHRRSILYTNRISKSKLLTAAFPALVKAYQARREQGEHALYAKSDVLRPTRSKWSTSMAACRRLSVMLPLSGCVRTMIRCADTFSATCTVFRRALMFLP
ncbi:MAG: DEAD/DEAH box helicase family protein [Alphaproteobacteria bacterium]|nr:DEAD/DEAH box helicase family protein [Alphaproteobacteria bacterium]